MIPIPFSSLSKRRGATLAGVFSLALGSVVLLCGAGSVPVENLLPQGAMQGDLNAGGHNLTNAATVSATNVVVSGSLTAPASFTLPFSKLTSTPTTLSGYGISDPIVLTNGSYANPAWITSLAYSKLSGVPAFITASGAPVQSVAGRTGAITLSASDVSGLAASATTDATDASNITSGTLAAARVATLNQNTTGSAGSVALSGVTGAGTGVLTAGAIAINTTGGVLTVGGGAYQPSSATLSTLAASNPFTAGSNITFSGTWPALTIAASGGGSLTFTSPLVNTSGTVALTIGSSGGVEAWSANLDTLASTSIDSSYLSAFPNPVDSSGGLASYNGLSDASVYYAESAGSANDDGSGNNIASTYITSSAAYSFFPSPYGSYSSMSVGWADFAQWLQSTGRPLAGNDGTDLVIDNDGNYLSVKNAGFGGELGYNNTVELATGSNQLNYSNNTLLADGSGNLYSNLTAGSILISGGSNSPTVPAADVSTSPTNKTTPVGWLPVTVNGTASWIPYYQ